MMWCASRAYLCHRRGRNYEQPKELLNGRESGGLNEGEKLKDGLDDLDDDSCKKTPQTSPQPLPNRHEVVKEQPQQPENVPQSENSTVTGMLMTDFENVKHYQTQNWVYRADMRLDDGSKIKLLIDTGFGKWPFYFLKTGHRVSVGGKKVKYYQQEARLVCKGDDFDFDDSAAKQVAS
uniref:Uncharacterized protein n=1 Tax=Panagrolaimus sp. JU765 TaxID=591449 RepID=A0AC34Q4Q8_9BILA